MRDRFALAALLGTAAAIFWFGYWLLTTDSAALAFGGVSVLAAVIVGALAGRRIAADATSSGNHRRGWAAGAVVTLAAFVLGAFLFALLPLFTTDAVGSEGAFEIIGGVFWMFGMGLLVGLLFLLPALPIGMWAGWLFYKSRSPLRAGAV